MRRGATAMAAPVVVERLDAAIFDTDGVITRTATVHMAAWKDLFDAFLADHAARTGVPFVPFTEEDYRRHVDGVPRFDGVARFLASRGIDLPRGDPADPPGDTTVTALGNRKNDAFLAAVDRDGVEAFGSTVALLHQLRAASVATAAISASENCAAVLAAAEVAALFDARVDGLDARDLGLAGKPDPAVFLEAAQRLGVAPARAAVLEDAIAGGDAGRRGGFGLVVGVDRTGHPDDLRAAGAHHVVADLDEVRVDRDGRWHVGR